MAIDNEYRLCDISAMDWKNIITELQELGLSQVEIGKELGKSQAWVADVLSGRYMDLKWADGQALLRLHKRAIKAPATAKKAA